jgi:hypothetical protein
MAHGTGYAKSTSVRQKDVCSHRKGDYHGQYQEH